MIRSIKALLLGLLAALVLAGCADTLDGPVTHKTTVPGYYYTYFQPIYTTTCSGNPSVCTQVQSGMIPIMYWVPPCYKIEVKGKDKKSTGSTCLNESEWNAIEVGDTYVGKDVQPKDRQVEKND